jgi:uncharacterized hydantoinase/oxoprolinase family protein
MRERKSTGKYSTLQGTAGMGWKDISETIKEEYGKCSVGGARFIFINVMKKFARVLCENAGESVTDEQIKELAESEQFQLQISNMLHKIYSGEGEE